MEKKHGKTVKATNMRIFSEQRSLSGSSIRTAEQLSERIMEQRRKLHLLVEQAKNVNKRFKFRHNKLFIDKTVYTFDLEKGEILERNNSTYHRTEDAVAD